MCFPLLLSLPLFFHAGIALLNVTVDDTDPSIVYKGSWEPSRTHRSGLDYGGTHTLSSDPTANATFNFTGVAVYYLAPLWPYAVNTQLRLDRDPPVVVNLTDPNSTPEIDGSESAMSSVVWSATGLANTTHQLLLSMASTGQFIIADGLTCDILWILRCASCTHCLVGTQSTTAQSTTVPCLSRPAAAPPRCRLHAPPRLQLPSRFQLFHPPPPAH
ncbi:hypothetical protein GGX14DRAFT_528874 [Mycena pura]|uniref:Uncharacterized protein n=1 Tax=Mycena pura TaxID=153505 RepID=A0AAD6Y2D8_9AGAR|nr:hypothetical protein GGX14DRAFT_528874 [Mycena pura]